MADSPSCAGQGISIDTVPYLPSLLSIWRKIYADSSLTPAHLRCVAGRDGAVFFRNTLLCIVLLFPVVAFAGDSGLEQKFPFNIPRQNAEQALIEFAEQADVTFIFPIEKVQEVITNELIGYFTRAEAISLLLDGTGLQPEIKANGALTVNANQVSLTKGDNKMKKSGLLASFIAAVIGSTVVDAQAQTTYTDTKSAVLEEVVVSAQKTSESLQEVPISVSAFSSETLDNMGLSNITQIADFSPNTTLDFTAAISGSSSALVAFIRGIGQSDFASNFEPGVGIYVDDVYYARTVGSVLDLLDVERIEILKGPQGTLFGRNTIGGAISVVTKKPHNEFEARAEVILGEYNRLDVRGTVNIPITGNLFGSIAYSSKNRDGYVQRLPFPGVIEGLSNLRYDGGRLNDLPSGNDLGNENNDNIRAKLLWDIDETKEFLLTVDYTRVRENSAPTSLSVVLPDVGPDGVPGTGDDPISGLYNACVAGVGPPICTNVVGVGDLTGDTPYDSRFLTGDRFSNYGNAISGTALDSWGITGTYTWQINDNLSLKSITSFRKLDSAFGEDADMSPIIIDHHGFVMVNDQITQELQLSGLSFDNRLQWLLGFYYFNEDGGIHDLVPLAGGLLQVNGPNTIDNTSIAVFGQGTFNLTEQWSLTFGLRYTDEEKDFTGGQRDNNALLSNLGLPLSLHPDPSDPTLYYPPGNNNLGFTDVSIRAGTEYRFNDDFFTYFSYSEGFKAGSWDTRVTAPVLVVPPFQEESASTYEVGFKSEWLNNTLRLNVSGFFTDYKNLQLIIQRGISPLTENAGKSEIKGVEVELQWLPTDGLLITGAYGWIDAKYTELDANANASGIFLTNELQNTPENSFSIATDYTQPLAIGGELHWHLDYAWKDDHFNDAVNTPELMQESFGLLGANVTYRAVDDKWYVGIGGSNLTNEEYIVSGFNQPGVGYIIATQGRPQEWWAKFGINF